MDRRKENSSNAINETILKQECTFMYALSLIGKRWKPAILWKMTEGVDRFKELKRVIPQISEKMLIQHLRELETDGLIKRTIYSKKPLNVTYNLTDLGKRLKPLLIELDDWGTYAKSANNA